jgi:ammonium transporter, Amt family
MFRCILRLSSGFAAFAAPAVAWAADAPKIDAADTAFIILCSALVLMMTLPGLAFFYAGMVRKKNVLSTLAHSTASLGLISLLWFAFGYSLTFSGDGAWLGNTDRLFLSGIGVETISPLAKTIPELLFMLYQMTFAVITCALIAGSIVDRVKFSAFLAFITLWLALVYVPTAHWVWGGGFLAAMGVVDFAGGIVVHINAGVAGLVAALVIGKRQGFGRENLAPFDLSMAVLGTGLLWVGWFGFNGGSALGAGSRAVFAITSTHLAACAGAIMWMVIEWAQRGRPSLLGLISGAIAGLGTITPASGFVLPWHGVVIGLIAGAVCYWFCTYLKHKLGYDDSLDVFGVHGVGGFLGTLLVGVFATASLSVTPEAAGISGILEGNWSQLRTQAIGAVVVTAWCGGVTFLILKLLDAVMGLRVSSDEEREGLDLTLHGEKLHQ